MELTIDALPRLKLDIHRNISRAHPDSTAIRPVCLRKQEVRRLFLSTISDDHYIIQVSYETLLQEIPRIALELRYNLLFLPIHRLVQP